MGETATRITIRAAGEKARTLETQNAEHRAASGGDAREASVFDTWRHAKQGLDDHGGISAIARDRFIEHPSAIVEGLTSQWSRASLRGTGQSIANQASDAGQQFLGLFGKGDRPSPPGALAKVGATFGLLISLEQLISTPLAMIPFPAFPAVRITDFAVGLPHGHAHPPTFGFPLPSIGPVIPIPVLSGAVRTLINGLPAARCGDLGIGIWCGGYFPMYEIFLGSSSVWIEGARAARLLVDITKHCIFTSPKPSDPPIGPMIGFTITASPNVIIGGVPMPSLLGLAMGAVFRRLFRGVGRLVNKIKVARAKARLIRLLEADEAALRLLRNSEDEFGPVIARAMDPLDGHISGVKSNTAGVPTDLDPILQRRINEIMQNPNLRSKHYSTPGTHAEILAADELLKRRRAMGMDVTEKDLDELVFHQRWMTDPPNPAPMCPHCSHILSGSESLAGKNTERAGRRNL